MTSIIETLLSSTEPSIRLKTRIRLLSEDTRSSRVLRLREEVRTSPRIKALLSERRKDGKIPWHPYAKWDGAHWVLAALADLGCPQGDKSLVPMKEQVNKWLLSNDHKEYAEARPYKHHPPAALLSQIKERPRIHGSMEGNAVWSQLTLDLFDGKSEKLVERLLSLQWPDGGWNCDGNPRAVNSSFMETALPLRALSLHGRLKRSSSSKSAAKRAAEVFLKRKLYRRAKTGSIINRDFVRLHYPLYWHYDVLHGLKILAEAGFINDARCEDALDLLEKKRLKNGGFPAESKYYRVSKSRGGRSLVDWGPVGPKTMNEFVTVDALSVLKETGRWKP
jgi:hypothetical protein